MLKDEDGHPLEGLWDPNTRILRIRAELSRVEGLYILWHELAHAMNSSRCIFPDEEDHDIVHGLNEWKLSHTWNYGGGSSDADDYLARWD